MSDFRLQHQLLPEFSACWLALRTLDSPAPMITWASAFLKQLHGANSRTGFGFSEELWPTHYPSPNTTHSSHTHTYTHTYTYRATNPKHHNVIYAVATLPSSKKWILTSTNAGYWNNPKSILAYITVYLVEHFLLSQRFSWSPKLRINIVKYPQKICQNTCAWFAKSLPKAS